jgi:transcriptional regulator with XRE-family HTH domain
LTIAMDPGEALDLDPAAEEPLAGDDDGHLGPGQIIPRGPVPDQLGANIAQLRQAAGLSSLELADRSGITQTAVASFEAGRHLPNLLVALKLAGSLGASIDRLTLGVFWNPGEVAGTGSKRKPRSQLLEGYFSTRPAHIGEAGSPPVPVTGRAEIAAIIGRNLRDARRRRLRSQRDLGRALGSEQTHISKIELGQLEPTLTTVIGLARELEVPIEALLAGIRWADLGPADAWGELRGRGGRARDLHSLDAVVARGCREERATWEIAKDLAVDEPTVRRVIERLRRRGRSLEADPATWTAADIEDELALRREEAERASDPITEEEAKIVVGEALRAHRRRLELSQEEIGDAAGFKHGRGLSNFEHRGPNFPITHLIRLAAALRLPCSELTEGLRWDPGERTFLLSRRRRPTERSPAAVIGQNARRIRQAARLPEEIVATRVGRRSNYFNALEGGGKLPRPVTLLMLACALEVEVAALLEGIRDWYVRPLLPLAIPEGEEAAERAAQQDRLLRLWHQGSDLQSIGEALDMKPQTAFAAINRLRELGVDIPYRKAPMTPAQLSGRLRRRRASRPLVPR